MVKKGAEERPKTFWFRNRWLFGPRNLQSALNEMFFHPLFLVSFFLLSHVYLSGKTPFSCLAGATPVPQKERRASVALICLHCWKEGMYILAKQCVSSERCAMPKACSVCHHGNKVEQTQQLQTKLSLQDVGLVVFLNLARRSLFFVKHDKRTDKATNHNDCTNNF